MHWRTVFWLLVFLVNTGAWAQTSLPHTDPVRSLRKAGVSNFSAPSLGDVDKDGDLDAVIGTASGAFLYFKNTGSATNPLYTQESGGGNPFGDQVQDMNTFSAPSLGDIDNDGDLDAIVGTANGDILYFKNVGTAINPLYTQQSGDNNPFEGQNQSKDAASMANSAPSLADLDGDGDLDAVIGTADGSLLYFKNVGTAINPLYTQQSGDNNPFEGTNQQENNNTSPSLGDVDGDGDLDAVVGTANGAILYFKNTGTATNPLYTQQITIGNPFVGPADHIKDLGYGSNTSPALGDVDGDGDLDVVVGTADGAIVYFENTGSSTNPIYTQKDGAENPFQPDLSPILYARPLVVNGPSPVTVVVDVAELNGVASSGLITLYITKDPMLALTFDPNAVSLPGHNGSLQNNQWTLDASPNTSYYVLTSQTSIAGQSVLSVGLSGRFTPGSTQGRMSISAIIVDGSGGENHAANNMDADKIDYFNK